MTQWTCDGGFHFIDRGDTVFWEVKHHGVYYTRSGGKHPGKPGDTFTLTTDHCEPGYTFTIRLIEHKTTFVIKHDLSQEVEENEKVLELMGEYASG